MSSLARLASRDAWNGTTLRNLNEAEIKRIEAGQPNREPWFGHQLEVLRRSILDSDCDHISNFSLFGVPRGFRSRGGSSANFHSLTHNKKKITKPESGQRSQWDFEESYKSGLRDGTSAAMLFEVQWSSWPFWRVGVELRRIVKRSDLPLSVVARLSMHYKECDQRERHDSDLLPLPLIELSAEDEVDSILQEWEDAPKDEMLDEQVHYSCQRIW